MRVTVVCAALLALIICASGGYTYVADTRVPYRQGWYFGTSHGPILKRGWYTENKRGTQGMRMPASETEGDDRSVDDLAAEARNTIKCPVCVGREKSLNELVRECPIIIEGERYKYCQFGTYVNDKCHFQRECYAGPNEVCTEKNENDMIGKKCAHGFTCSKSEGVCRGMGSQSAIDIIDRLLETPNTNSPMCKANDIDPKFYLLSSTE